MCVDLSPEACGRIQSSEQAPESTVTGGSLRLPAAEGVVPLARGPVSKLKHLNLIIQTQASNRYLHSSMPNSDLGTDTHDSKKTLFCFPHKDFISDLFSSLYVYDGLSKSYAFDLGLSRPVMDLGFTSVRALARTYTNKRKQPVSAQTDRN